MRGGLPANTPAAVIRLSHLGPHQQNIVSTLDGIAAEAYAPISRPRPWPSSAILCVPANGLLDTCAHAIVIAHSGQVTAPRENSTCDG